MSIRTPAQSRDSIRERDDISFTVRLLREGDAFVAHVPELDVCSCGDTIENARRNVREAVIGFLRSAERMGTLNEILEEAGYRLHGERWIAPEFVAIDQLTVNVPA